MNHAAPHKPFLLLSIIDLIAQGKFTENFFEPPFELVDTWNDYWRSLMPLGRTSSMAYPYFFMKSEGFWHLVSNRELDIADNFRTPSMNWLKNNFSGARVDDDLFVLLVHPESREQLRAVLIQNYFTKEIQPTVWEQGTVNRGSYIYEKELLKGIKEQIDLFEETPEDRKSKIRDQGFRKAIVTLYHHRCALCGIRMLTPEGHTVVEAAHIVPWSESKDDRPTNGLCLCRLCHWSFDEGLMSVGKSYEVLVSVLVRIDQNIPGHILTLQDRPIFKPVENRYWPAQENLQVHRKNCYMK